MGLLYGQRALGIGALAPLNFVGTRNHSRALERPFQRLTHTASAFETIFFGPCAEADRVLDAVRRLHGRVEGELTEAAGPVPAGTPYSAFDPKLMLWTVAVIADSAEVLYELLVRRLSDDEREALWSDYLRFGELFGMERSAAPTSYAEFRSWWHARLASDELFLTAEARYVGSSIMFHIPVPRAQRVVMPAHNLVVLGSLPPRVRELYGLRWTGAHRVAFEAAVAALRASRPLAPPALRRGPNSASFELVAATESARIARGERVRGALA